MLMLPEPELLSSINIHVIAKTCSDTALFQYSPAPMQTDFFAKTPADPPRSSLDAPPDKYQSVPSYNGKGNYNG